MVFCFTVLWFQKDSIPHVTLARPQKDSRLLWVVIGMCLFLICGAVTYRTIPLPVKNDEVTAVTVIGVTTGRIWIGVVADCLIDLRCARLSTIHALRTIPLTNEQ